MNCIFCKIINKEIPSLKIYEDDDFLVIMDISPASRGHAILMPKTHNENLFDFDTEILSKALPIAKKVGSIMMKELQCDGLNILQNNNESAGQTVFHFHIHLIPRYVEDNVNISWQDIEYKIDEAEKIANTLYSKLMVK